MPHPRRQLSTLTSKEVENLVINMASRYFEVIDPTIPQIRIYVNFISTGLFAGYLTVDGELKIEDHLVATLT